MTTQEHDANLATVQAMRDRHQQIADLCGQLLDLATAQKRARLWGKVSQSDGTRLTLQDLARRIDATLRLTIDPTVAQEAARAVAQLAQLGVIESDQTRAWRKGYAAIDELLTWQQRYQENLRKNPTTLMR